MCGSDWRQYEPMYYAIKLDDPFANMVWEPGFYAIMYIFRLAGLSYWIFSIVVKLVCFVVFYKFILKYSGKYVYLALMFFVSFYGIYLLVDAPMRNLCAVSICILAYSLKESHKIVSFVIIFIALSFHSTAILMILLYFLINREINSKCYVIAYVLLICVSFVFSSYIEEIANSPLGLLLMGNDSKFEKYYVNGYSPQSLGSSPMALGELLKLILFIWLIINRKTFETIKNGKFLFNGVMLFFLLAKLGAMSNILVRLGCYLSPFYAIALCLVTEGLVVRMRRLYMNGLFFIAFLLCYMGVTSDYRYVPYSNYIIYSLTHDNLPNFNLRSEYNLTQSPYIRKEE